MSLPPTRTLLALGLMASMGLAYLWLDPQGHLRNTTWVAPGPLKPQIDAPAKMTQRPDASMFSATLERPLFAPDRRPPPPVLPPAPPPPPDPLADAQLVGLIAGDAGAVIVRSEGTVRRISLNQPLGAWTLKAIDDRTATFEKAGEQRTLRLEYARLGVAAPAVAKQNPAASNALANAARQQGAAALRQADEEEAKNRDLAAMRARMSQKKP